MFYENGDRYEGDFKDNKKEGKGIMHYKKGKKKKGDWKDDELLKKGLFG